MAGKQLVDKFGRMSWDIYYLSIANVVSMRSIDPSTKHGAVIVSKNNRILSSGYNGPIKGSDDDAVPLTRPEKYYHLLHSEENCLLAYSGSSQDIAESTCYVTGRPCHKCLRMLIQKGIKRIVHSGKFSLVIDEDDMKAQELMLKNSDVKIEECDLDEVLLALRNTTDYIFSKKSND